MHSNSKKKCGIIVGLDTAQEYLLPLFYLNLRLCSDLPITFFDFGMSVFGQDFCSKRGQIIKINESLCINDLSQETSTVKSAWFKKPLACKKAPYNINLWLDLDCKTTQNLGSLFEKVSREHDLYLALDESASSEAKIKGLDYLIFNSGVLLFKKDAPFISLWIDTCYKQSFRGDQDALSYALYAHSYPKHVLDSTFNTIAYPLDDSFDNINILHYITSLKELLANEYSILESMASQSIFTGK